MAAPSRCSRPISITCVVPPRPPNTLMVMGIIGYTQGVSAVSRPAVRANRKALPAPREAAAEKLSARAGAAASSSSVAVAAPAPSEERAR